MSKPVMNSDSTILAVGATGKFAGLVVPALAQRSAKVRGLIRDPKQGDAVLKNGATEVAIADLNDRSSLDAALKGIDAVFYIAPAFMSNEVEVGKSIVTAAQQAGVRRFVFSSVIDPVISLTNHSAKAPVEAAIVESGMEYTILQPTLFFQNLARGWAGVLDTGTYGEPWSAETRFSRVDYRDVAEVAAIALTEDRLLYGTFQLCAEGLLNRQDVAALMGEVLGRKIEAVRSNPPAIPTPNADAEQQVSPMQMMIDWYDHHALVGNALTLRAILDREPRTLRDYFKELAAHHQINGLDRSNE